MSKRLYDNMYPASIRDFDTLAEAYCCGEVKFVHFGCEYAPTCVFCEDACNGCEKSVF
jgi:hypothetical protein